LSPTGFAFLKDGILLLLVKPFIPRRIIHLHGKGIQDELRRSKFHRYLYSRVFSGCEVVHLSHGLLADTEGLPCMARHVVANGVPAQLACAPTEKKYDFIYLSNLLESKGVFVFIEALGQLRSQGASFQVAIVGAEAEEAIQTKITSLIAKLGLCSHLELLGPLYGADKYAALRASRVFVLPTFYDCFPLSILEAMSVGLPVISTDEGAISEIVEDGKSGLIVERRSAGSLTSALQYLLDNPHRISEMSQMARDKFDRTYSMHIFIKRMRYLFDLPSPFRSFI